jgi:hypothetical protein
VAGTFSVGALALAAEGANAVGAVRLTLLPDGLEIELVRAAGFRAGFVPGGVAQAVEMRVPFTAIRGLVRRGRALCLALDPSVAAPYTRFTLARFTHDPAEALGRAYEARRRAALSVALLPGPLGLVAALAAPASLVSGPLGRSSLGLVVALVAWLLLREALRWATWGGPASDRQRDGFEVELCRRLGFAPVTTAPFAPPEAGPVAHAPEPSPLRAPALVALIAVGAVAGLAFLQRYAPPPEAEEVETPVALLGARLAPLIADLVPSDLVPAAPRLPRCVCARADSPLWKDGVSLLEVLVASRPEDGTGRVFPTLRRGDRAGYDFDLSVVNNGAAPLREIKVVVTFARRNAEGRRVGAKDRGLYWGSSLLGGRAVKWHLSGPGTEMRIEPSITSLLEGEPASPDAFFELGKARQRIVRIHAAKMLAYLRDPRASDVLTSLGAPSTGEEIVLARIARASRPVIACDLAPGPEGTLSACLFNGSVTPLGTVALRDVPVDEGAVARRAPLSVEVPVHDGVRVSAPLGGSSVPAEIEVELASP